MACWELPDRRIDKKFVPLVLSTAVPSTQQVRENCGILVIKVDFRVGELDISTV